MNLINICLARNLKMQIDVSTAFGNDFNGILQTIFCLYCCASSNRAQHLNKSSAAVMESALVVPKEKSSQNH